MMDILNGGAPMDVRLSRTLLDSIILLRVINGNTICATCAMPGQPLREIFILFHREDYGRSSELDAKDASFLYERLASYDRRANVTGIELKHVRIQHNIEEYTGLPPFFVRE